MTTPRPVTIERHPEHPDWEAYCHVHRVRMLAESHAAVYEMAAGHLTMVAHARPDCAHEITYRVGNDTMATCFECGDNLLIERAA